MGIVVRQSIKGTLVSYIGVLIGLVNTLWLLPYVFTAEQIGLYRVLIDVATFLMIFGQFGLMNAGIRFFPYFKDPQNQHNGFLFFMLTITAGGFILISAVLIILKEKILYLFSDNAELLLNFIYIILPLTFSVLLFNILETYARSLLKVVIPKLFKEVILRILISISAITYFFELIDFVYFIDSLIVIYAIINLGLVFYIYSLGQLFLKPNFNVFHSSRLKTIAEYCFFTFLLAGSGIIVGKIDTIMLTSLSTLSATGIYSIAFYMGIMVEIPKRSMVNITAPLVAGFFKESRIDKISELYKKTSTHLMLAGGIILGLIWFNIDNIFLLIPNSEVYATGKYVVLLIGLAKFVDLSMSINAEILGNSDKYKWNLFLMPLLAVLAVVTNYFLIPVYGLTGAAIATFISIVVYNLFRFFIVYFLFKIHPFSIQTLKCLLIFIFIILAGILIPDLKSGILTILIKSSAIGIISAAGILILKPSEELSKLVTRTLKIFLKN